MDSSFQAWTAALVAFSIPDGLLAEPELRAKQVSTKSVKKKNPLINTYTISTPKGLSHIDFLSRDQPSEQTHT